MAKPKAINPLYFELFDFRPRKGDLRKAALVEMAIKQVWKNGVEHVTLDSVGKSMGIRRSHVAYYFSEKSKLLDAAIRFSMATGQHTTIEHLKRAKNPKEQLKAYVHGNWEWVQKHPEHISLIILNFHYATYDKNFHALAAEYKEAGRARLEEIIRNGMRGKPTPKEIRRISREGHNIVVADILEWMTTDSGFTGTQMRDTTLKSLFRLLGSSFK